MLATLFLLWLKNKLQMASQSSHVDAGVLLLYILPALIYVNIQSNVASILYTDKMAAFLVSVFKFVMNFILNHPLNATALQGV